jgi:Xaa-Pro aminopeptidase
MAFREECLFLAIKAVLAAEIAARPGGLCHEVKALLRDPFGREVFSIGFLSASHMANAPSRWIESRPRLEPR